jgi:hypothetical protein
MFIKDPRDEFDAAFPHAFHALALACVLGPPELASSGSGDTATPA